MSASFKELNPALAREPRLVKYNPYNGNVYTPDSSLVMTHVPFRTLRRKLKHWVEADIFVERMLGDAHHAMVWVGLDADTSSKFYVADPSEVKELYDEKHVVWSYGEPASISTFSTATIVVVEAHRVIGALCALQRVNRFAEADGDHAIGERVVRFLVHPDFLLNDDDSCSEWSVESDETMEVIPKMWRGLATMEVISKMGRGLAMYDE